MLEDWEYGGLNRHWFMALNDENRIDQTSRCDNVFCYVSCIEFFCLMISNRTATRRDIIGEINKGRGGKDVGTWYVVQARKTKHAGPRCRCALHGLISECVHGTR